MGFVESLCWEVEPFGIAMTIADPGSTHTDFGRGLVRAPVMIVYKETLASAVRRAFAVTGNSHKMVDAELRSAEQSPAPLWLALGRTTYESIKTSRSGRLAEHGAQKQITLTMDDEDR